MHDHEPTEEEIEQVLQDAGFESRRAQIKRAAEIEQADSERRMQALAWFSFFLAIAALALSILVF